SNEKLAGKQGDYTVTLHKIEEKHLPELDDALAEQVSNGEIKTFEDLSKVVSDNILENKKRRVRDELREQVINAVIEQSEFTLHPLLVDEEIEAMVHQFSHMLEQQRLSMDQYLMMMRKNLDEYKQELRPDAENRIKRQLVLDEIANRESIGIGVEELEALYQAYAQAGQVLPQTPEQIQSLAISYRREKALTRLVELTTPPDPDLVSEDEATTAHAQEAAIIGETISADTHNESVETEESATATSLPSDEVETGKVE
ncbi:MAG TPA: hypothetical protein VFU49_05805, partial [Ktedonobacteraceae bacterium]|nr:hypothetical protein [Ktedonobacteraceae bacterium]